LIQLGFLVHGIKRKWKPNLKIILSLELQYCLLESLSGKPVVEVRGHRSHALEYATDQKVSVSPPVAAEKH
jgi:hypothetical protein